MGEVIQLQGDQRKDVQEFLVDKNGLELDAKTIKVNCLTLSDRGESVLTKLCQGPWVLSILPFAVPYPARTSKTDSSHRRMESFVLRQLLTVFDTICLRRSLAWHEFYGIG